MSEPSFIFTGAMLAMMSQILTCGLSIAVIVRCWLRLATEALHSCPSIVGVFLIEVSKNTPEIVDTSPNELPEDEPVPATIRPGNLKSVLPCFFGYACWYSELGSQRSM